MITLTNNSIYHSDLSLFTLSTLDNVERINAKEIINFLSDTIELGESVTFKRIFSLISPNLDKFNEIFYSALGGYKLDPFLQEIENDPTEEKNMDFLEIHWFSDRYDNELNISPSLHGVKFETSEVEEEQGLVTYALDFTSLNNLKNYVVKINQSVELFEYNEDTEKKYEKVELGYKSFTLFDLFCAIFFEISFHGGPLDKKERFKELEESISEIDKTEFTELKNLTTFEEMIEKIDSRDEYLVKYKEQRDRVEIDRMTSGKNLSKLKICLLEKLKIYDVIENSDENLEQYYKKITDIEYDMQLLYEEEEDISYHRFWETPKCTCPKIDNLEIYPSDTPFFDKDCPIHKKH